MDYNANAKIQEAINELQRLNTSLCNEYKDFCHQHNITILNNIAFSECLSKIVSTLGEDLEPRKITTEEAKNIYRYNIEYSFGQDLYLKTVDENEIKFKRNKNNVIAYSICNDNNRLRVLTVSKYSCTGLEAYEIEWNNLIDGYIVIADVNMKLPDGISILSSTSIDDALKIVNTFFIDKDWSEFIQED